MNDAQQDEMKTPGRSNVESQSGSKSEPTKPMQQRKWRSRATVLKVQVTLNNSETRHVEGRSETYGVSNATVIKGAIGLFAWCCRQIARGYDVGAYNRETRHFVAVDVPYADEIDFTVTPVEVEDRDETFEAATWQPNGKPG